MKSIHTSLITAAIAAFLGSFFAFSCDREDRTIRVGERIHHDDFEYSVASYHVSKMIGEGKEAITATGNFYIVDFRTENRAKRVYHEWADSIAYVMDEGGTIYENFPWAQKALRRTGRLAFSVTHVTPPGSTDSTVLVFDLPEDVSAPALMVRGETLMGDFFDGGQFRRVKIALWQ